MTFTVWGTVGEQELFVMKSLKERKGDMSHDPGGQVSSRPSTQGLTEAEDSGRIGRNFWQNRAALATIT